MKKSFLIPLIVVSFLPLCGCAANTNQQEIEPVLLESNYQPVTNEQTDLPRVYFTPSADCENHIIEKIETSKKIDIAVYSITNDKIVDALIKAKSNGSNIRIITDRLQSKGKTSLVSKLRNSGFTIKMNIKHKIMHNKFAIFDGQEIESGSYNWTNSASKSNAENCMFFKQNIEDFSDQFEYLWKFYD